MFRLIHPRTVLLESYDNQSIEKRSVQVLYCTKAADLPWKYSISISQKLEFS